MKKALITGITGQDGSYLAEFLLDKGYEVHGIKRRASSFNTHRIDHIYVDPHTPGAKLYLHYGDLSDPGILTDIIWNIKPDEIYHLGAQSHVRVSFDMPEYTSNVTGLGTTRILEAIKRSGIDTKFYQASSSEMFGNAPSPQSEKTPFYPRSPYAISKLYAYWMTVNYREAYDIFASNGILFNHECISENTPLIIRKNNIISIKRPKDIRKPRQKGKNIQQWLLEDVEIWDGNDFVPVNCITATKRKKNSSEFTCKTLNTRGGAVGVTNHHKMLDEKGNQIKAKDVKLGTKLLHRNFPKCEEVSVLSKEESKFLGMMVGDGWIGKDGRANFACNKEVIMREFEELWRKIGQGTINSKTYKTEYGISTRAKLNGNNSYLKYIQKQIYTKDGLKKVPDRVLNASKEVKLAFLEGYNKCDGLKSNLCTYKFKNFKTNSSILAQGLLLLIKQTTGQEFNITFEPDEKYYGYYSINLLSTMNNLQKEREVKKMLKTGAGQREINRSSGISRDFIRKIQKGGHAVLNHHLSKPKNEVKKALTHRNQPEWVFDIETESGEFMAGVGTMVVSNSPRRGKTFVTRKITRAIANMVAGNQDKIYLGNLDARRDWGFAPEYIEVMWLMLQQDTPDDYVIGTGETHTIREFLEKAFRYVGIGIKWKGKGVDEEGMIESISDKYLTEDSNINEGDVIIKIDPRYFRPTEADCLRADITKARNELRWEPRTTFEELIKIMVDYDMKAVDIDYPGEGIEISKSKGFKYTNHDFSFYENMKKRE